MSTKAREIPMILQSKGTERGVVFLLTELFERQAALEAQQREVGASLLQMAQIIDQVTTGAGVMRQQIERMQGKEEDDDLPPLAS
jgi:hypothetical protein